MSRVSINAGLLQMIVNGLKRDFAEGKTIRGEWVEDIERDARPIEEAAAEPNRAVELSRDDVIRMAREAGAGVALYMSSPPRISDALFRGKALETFTHLVIANFLARTGQYVTNDASREAAIEAVAPWKNAVIEQLVVAHIFAAEHENDPRKAIQDLLAYHADIAVDPRVSEAAASLVDQGRAEENEACEKMCQSIEDEYMRNESGKWSEMKSDAQTGAGDCVSAIRERRTAAKPSDRMVQWVKDQAEKRERVAAEHVARGECPECDGSGEIGGQFSGGDVPCPSCAGTGRLSQGNQS